MTYLAALYDTENQNRAKHSKKYLLVNGVKITKSKVEKLPNNLL